MTPKPERRTIRRPLVMCSVLLLLGVRPTTPQDYDFLQKVVNFEKHYDPFYRKLAGCPPASKRPILGEGDCRPREGVLDYADFRKARQAAMSLFDLAEK